MCLAYFSHEAFIANNKAMSRYCWRSTYGSGTGAKTIAIDPKDIKVHGMSTNLIDGVKVPERANVQYTI